MEGKKYIAVNSYPLLCSSTDGLIGSRLSRLTGATTLERAKSAVDKWHDSNEEEGYGIPWEAGTAYVVEAVKGRFCWETTGKRVK